MTLRGVVWRMGNGATGTAALPGTGEGCPERDAVMAVRARRGPHRAQRRISATAAGHVTAPDVPLTVQAPRTPAAARRQGSVPLTLDAVAVEHELHAGAAGEPKGAREVDHHLDRHVHALLVLGLNAG